MNNTTLPSSLDQLADRLNGFVRLITASLVIFGILGNAISFPALKRQLRKGKIQDGFIHQIIIISVDMATLFLVIGLIFFGALDFFGTYPSSIPRRRGMTGAFFVYCAYLSRPFYGMLRTMIFNYLIGMSIDRLDAVFRPLQYFQSNQRLRAKIMVSVSTILAVILHFYELFYSAVVYNPSEDAFKIEHVNRDAVWILTAVKVQLFARIASVGVLVGLGIAIQLRFKAAELSPSSRAFAKALNSLFLGQVCLVLACSIPWLVFKIHQMWFEDPEHPKAFVTRLIQMALSIAYVVEVSFNFLIYLFISTSFRREVWNILGCKEKSAVTNISKFSKSGVNFEKAPSNRHASRRATTAF